MRFQAQTAMPLHSKIMRDLEETKRKYSQTTIYPKTYKQRFKEIFLDVGILTVTDFIKRVGLSNKTYYSIVNEEPADLDPETVAIICFKLRLGLAQFYEISELYGQICPRGSLIYQSMLDMFSIHTTYTTDEMIVFYKKAREADLQDREAKSKQIANKRASERSTKQ